MISVTPSRKASNSQQVNWKSQDSHIVQGLRNLFSQDGALLTDVTLASDGEYFKAHKLVLSLCSSFFRELFQRNRADKSNTIIILGHVSSRDLRYLLRFMYEGKVDIPNKHFESFLEAGRMLKVAGLENKYSMSNWTSERKVASSESGKVKRARVEQSALNDPLGDIFLSDREDNDDGDGGGNSNLEHPYIKKEAAPPVLDTDNDDQLEMNDLQEHEDVDGEVFKSPSEIVRKPFPRSYASRRKIPRARSSPAWKFFTANANFTRAKCKLCTETETILSTSSTSGLIRHLQSFHPKSIPDAVTTPKIIISESSDDDKGQDNSHTELVKKSAPISQSSGPRDRRSGRKRARRSLVWKFFKPTPCRLKATCKMCIGVPVTLKTSQGGTTGLLRHLQGFHPKKYQECRLAKQSFGFNVSKRNTVTEPSDTANKPDETIVGENEDDREAEAVDNHLESL